MGKPLTLALATVTLAGMTLGSCDRPAATPPHPAPARLSERWQTVVIKDRKACPNNLVCLVALSHIDRPTTVSIKQVSFAKIRNVDACMPNEPLPWLTSADISFESYIYEVQTTGVSPSCPAFGLDQPSTRLPNQYEDWRRSDQHYFFEAQYKLSYSFVPLGSSDTPKGPNVRCVVVYDPSGQPEELPRMALSEASEICLVLFYFRERSTG